MLIKIIIFTLLLILGVGMLSGWWFKSLFGSDTKPKEKSE